MSRPEILKRDILWEGRFLRSLLITYRNSRGETVTWEAYQRKGTEGIVAVVPFTEGDEVVLIKQFRPPVGRYVVEFPAGLNDRDEPLEEVARRELLEETGYSADRLFPILTGPLSSGASTELLTVFLAIDAVDTGSQRLDDVEEIEVIRIPVGEFYDRIMDLIDEETYLDLKIPGLFELAKRKRDEIKKAG